MKCPECDRDLPDGTGICGRCGIRIRIGPEDSEAHTRTLETPSVHLSPGLSFADRYQIIEELGKGGMGTVYRALDMKLDEEVAIKVIRPEIASDPDTVLRFSHELKLARRISHRNIGRLYELMESKGHHFITMEYIPGLDLHRLIKKATPMPVEKAVTIAAQICEGLREAHRLGIVHRDLKPGNVLIDKEGRARILDFGIARSVDTEGMTRLGMTVGTPEYMSPEQVDGQAADERADIYSLGIILYEMLTGRRPFEGKNVFAIGYKHLMVPPRDPVQLNPDIPLDLSRFILKCLQKDKSDRYRGAAEALAELQRIKEQLQAS